MKPKPRLNKKWTLIYSLAIIGPVVSIFCLTLSLDTKLRLFCAIDDAHIAETPPTWNPGYWRTPYTEYVKGYWTNPTTGTNLAVITIWEVIDGGTWLYYDNIQNIFWITIQRGPMKNTVYGPYQGKLWALTNTINPLAIAGITLSIIPLIYRPIRKLWTKPTRPKPQTFKEFIITVSKRKLMPSETEPSFRNHCTQHPRSSSQRTRGADYYF